MTVVPLPASPCMRVRLLYTQTDGFDAGSRFYLGYSGAAPTSGNCATLASDIAGLWNTDLVDLVGSEFALSEVDVLDIATDSGNSGVWTGSHSGGATGAQVPSQCATNLEFDIGRRYRGGKPRMFLPPSNAAAQQDAGHWTADFVADVNSQFGTFMTAVEALSIGAVGTLAHVNLSYYKGFTNVTNSSGRTRAAPKYRDSAVVDTITGYSCKSRIGSQKRRRTATSY